MPGLRLMIPERSSTLGVARWNTQRNCGSYGPSHNKSAWQGGYMPKEAGTVPTAGEARAYVKAGVFGVGGVREALLGVWHKTLPLAFGKGRHSSWTRLGLATAKYLVIAGIAAYPLLTNRALSERAGVPLGFIGPPDPNQPWWHAVPDLWRYVCSLSKMEYTIAVGAVGLTLLLALIQRLLERQGDEPHAPEYQFSAAIKAIPMNAVQDVNCEEAIRLTLFALRDQMAKLIHDEGRTPVTDITVLQFCDETGARMKVRARTANHEDVDREIASNSLMAYYVAMLGCTYAEHDFLHSRNPFPPFRVSVIGSPRVEYRSVLYIPITRFVSETLPHGAVGPAPMVDKCMAVICVHSAKAYRFWRWGDHRKKTGSFVNVATQRAMPYIALLKLLLEPTSPLVKVEGHA